MLISTSVSAVRKTLPNGRDAKRAVPHRLPRPALHERPRRTGMVDCWSSGLQNGGRGNWIAWSPRWMGGLGTSQDRHPLHGSENGRQSLRLPVLSRPNWALPRNGQSVMLRHCPPSLKLKSPVNKTSTHESKFSWYHFHFTNVCPFSSSIFSQFHDSKRALNFLLKMFRIQGECNHCGGVLDVFVDDKGKRCRVDFFFVN